MASRTTIFSAQSKQDVAQKTVAHLLDDANAMAEWNSNIEKIRQKESDARAKHSS